ncbi:spore coat protein U domain-containing protein [Xanthomonas sp. A2111]|uniref:Spore coat U domain-containing protein n=1 Tax=Xanthomonas hawaiiensis TaxID=3003247 RepID=A0ABU2IA17_9XANT|nr:MULTISPECIES: spore coat U domain-containing protein [unclassified Xanthomonas]MBO9827310.1 spore coat protein U domain-containing protein [Xanthomonas sp. A2111]MBO9872660.1 spore coat protein U domain-containing protein [Xanthomonas sp. D-93]MDS9994602.1 spore coat U domain-containing protein [Xanthomonas sp. A2111]MDS9995177.1 spore coat U domain-containing protein [Xanthomonas sp. A2111]WNH46293.1 spore coat U domain-containing protein [Xanthomonas sp. A6251]
MSARAWPMALTALLLAAVALLPQRAAATTTCTAQATAASFGTLSDTAATDTTAQILVTCQTGAISVLGTIYVRMCLNIGEGAQGAGFGITPRRMLNPLNDILGFQLYRDSARSLIWGSALSGSTPLQVDLTYASLATGGTGTATYVIYARVPLQSGIATGTYQNSFSGVYTNLQYRYDEPLVGNPAVIPASCTTGGKGGGTSVQFPFVASATAAPTCTIASIADLDFGTQSGLIDNALNYTTTLSMNCRARTAWQVSLDNGQNASGNVRRMRSASGQYLTYELYRDAARTQRWGSTLNTDTQTGTGTGSAQSLTLYGRVPARQTPAPGSYSDVVKVTVTY